MYDFFLLFLGATLKAGPTLLHKKETNMSLAKVIKIASTTGEKIPTICLAIRVVGLGILVIKDVVGVVTNLGVLPRQ